MAGTSSPFSSLRPEWPTDGCIRVANAALAADCAGALYWAEHGLLAVADLHLEKGSSFARRGTLLPPYDTTETLARLARLIARYAPRIVVALGDNFHDGDGPARLSPPDRASLTALQRSREWIWIAGNHDPEPAEGIGGAFAASLSVGALTFRHQLARNAPQVHDPEKWKPVFGKDHAQSIDKSLESDSTSSNETRGEIAGHLHPVARIVQRGRAVSRRCFVTDGKALVMPAFGAYTGGLNIRDRAFAAVFGTRQFTAHMLGEERLYAFAASRCLID